MEKFTKGFGILGLILIVFGVIALAITRLLNWYFYSHMILGAVLIVLYAIFNFETFRERMRERSTKEGSKVFVYSAIVVLIFIALNIVSYRKSTRFDVTESKVFSLEEQTIKVVENLKSPVEITGFFHAKNNLREAFKDLLATYQGKSKLVSAKTIDPDKQPAIANRLQIKDGDIRLVYGAKDLALTSFDEGRIREALKNERIQRLFIFAEASDPNFKKLTDLVSSGDLASKGITVERLQPDSIPPAGVETELNAAGSIYLQFAHKDTTIREVSEQAITNAIMQIAREQTPVVRFTSGHGEHPLDDESESGYSILKSAIQNEGYDVDALKQNLLQGVPAGTQVLIIAGGVTPFTKEEAGSLNSYLEAGGKVIIMADPNFSNPKLNPTVSVIDTGLEEFLSSWGIELGRNVILEQHLQLLAGKTVDPFVLPRDYGAHEITRPLKDRETFFHVARTVSRSAKVSEGKTVTEIIFTSGGGNSWAETNLTELISRQKATYDGKDLKGPVSLAMVAEQTTKDNQVAKLVVFGDADFVMNRFIRSQEFNYDLFLNTLNWMWGKVEQISIRPKQLRSSKLLLSDEQTNLIFYAAVLTIPELVLIIGLLIYWRRRSR